MQPGLSKVSLEVSDEAYLISLADDPFLVRLDDGLWKKIVIFFLQKMKASKDAFPERWQSRCHAA